MAEDLMPQQSLHPQPSGLAQELHAGAGRTKEIWQSRKHCQGGGSIAPAEI